MPPPILPTPPPPAVETCHRTGRRFIVLPEGEMIRSTDHCTLVDAPSGVFITQVQMSGFPVRHASVTGLRYLRPLL